MALLSNSPKGAACPPPSSGLFGGLDAQQARIKQALLGGRLGAMQQAFGPSATQQAMYDRERELQLQAMQRATCPPPIPVPKDGDYMRFDSGAILRFAGKDGKKPFGGRTDTPWQAFCRTLRQEMDEWLKLDLN